ncbi:hypothetical protein GHT06_020505 [Daphnia sinensis]|uniref:Uncharacterized protein n=1 Tax=Daphnia sinensis TaxID=1820382 RepID=A0AAD5KHX4_9CRUS|nr:hypothetical protein GHT06_020505 [Daphnia sinensis]
MHLPGLFLQVLSIIQEKMLVRNAQLWEKGRIVFPSVNAPLRTDESFRERFDPDHHNNYSCLEELNVDMVLDFPLDPMHLVDEGACRKFFFTLLFETDYKVSPYTAKRIDDAMSILSQYTPGDFPRKPRPFTTKMKATEWRQLRLYTGPVVLLNRIAPERYGHFLTFYVASKILTCSRFHVQYGQYAKEL